MINARRSLETKASRQHVSQVDIFFLNMAVRRSHLVEDSLKEVGAGGAVQCAPGTAAAERQRRGGVAATTNQRVPGVHRSSEPPSARSSRRNCG